MKIVNFDLTGIKKFLPDLSDIFVFAGLAGIFYGIYQIFPPAAFITGGILLGALGIAGSKK